MDLDPLSGTIGAIVVGADLARMDAAGAAELLDALVEHKVLFFREQHGFGPAEQVRFASFFGPLELEPAYPHLDEHPEVVVVAEDGRGSAFHVWHADSTHRVEPALGTILRAVDVPPRGRDTIWADMEAVYADLSAEMQHFLARLSARHRSRALDSMYQRGAIATEPVGALHPVVRTHPVSGRPCLFVNRLFTRHIDGLSERESDHLLAFLFDLVATPEYQVRWRWEPGSVAFWDNRSCQHAVVCDYLYPRVMHRVTIRGDVPKAPVAR